MNLLDLTVRVLCSGVEVLRLGAVMTRMSTEPTSLSLYL